MLGKYRYELVQTDIEAGEYGGVSVETRTIGVYNSIAWAIEALKETTDYILESSGTFLGVCEAKSLVVDTIMYKSITGVSAWISDSGKEHWSTEQNILIIKKVYF